MYFRVAAIWLLSASANVLFLTRADEEFSVAFQWNYINYTWPSAEQMSKSGYVPGEDVIAGVKIYKDVVYLALPRVKKSSRVTLAAIPMDANRENPLLEPFPSWEMNSGPSCDAFQDVMSMEIDKDGIMWVLDARRVDSNTDCPPKITLLDLEDGGRVVSDFVVPDDLCPHQGGCFLNDIVVDGDFAYVSDTTSSDPGIFVYNRKSGQAWKARDQSMHGDPHAAKFEAQGVEYTGPGHINGIALTPDCGGNRTFYYMAQASLHMFSIANTVLKNRSLATGRYLHDFITDEGTKQAQSGGMICDTDADIYYGLQPLDAVGRWDTKKTPLSRAGIVEENHELIKWPDSFSIFKGTLYLITNSILRFIKQGEDNLNEVNFRIIKLRTNTESYIYCKSSSG